MLSKFGLFRNILILLSIIFISSCKEDIVEPELYGSISGIVMDQDASSAIEGASITTSPPTSAILSGKGRKVFN